MALEFSFEAIKNRMIRNLQSKTSWANVLPFGTNARIIDTVADALSEEARFNVYLTNENKWTLAQNRSSLFYQADLLTYEPRRHVAAVGSVRVSTAEDAVNLNVRTWDFSKQYLAGNRVGYLGEIYEALNDVFYDDGNPDNLTKTPANDTSNWERVTGLTHTRPIPIPRFSSFGTIRGLEVCTVSDFVLDNTKDYLDVDVVQGTPKTETRLALGEEREQIEILNTNIAQDYYRVTVNGVEWTETSDLRLNDGEDLVYEILPKADVSGIIIQFGDDIFGKRLLPSDEVIFEFVETLGVSGNITSANIVTETVSAFFDDLDNAVDLLCVNEFPIVGGKDPESVEDIRTNAPRVFQTGGRATSSADYKAILETEFDFISRAIVWGSYERNLDLGLDPSTYVRDQDNRVYVSAFTTGGIALNSAQESEIQQRINQYKAPTDILSFVQAEIVGLVFHSTIKVSDRSYTLSRVENNVKTALAAEYDIDNLAFGQNLYESDFKAFIDNTPGVGYHNTEIEFSNSRFLSVGWATESFKLSIPPITPGTVRVFVRDTGEVDPQWYQIGRDNGAGGFVGVNGHSMPEATIVYNFGDCRIQFDEVGPFFDDAVDPRIFDRVEVKVMYYSEEVNYELSRRNEIFRYDDTEVTISYT